MSKNGTTKLVGVLGMAAAGMLLGGCPSGSSSGAALEPPFPEVPGDAPLAAMVDPFIGTANDGQTFPGPAVPWGMASASPHTTLTDPMTFLGGTVANAGYLNGEPRIHGFGQTHLSGVGCPDLGAVVVVPTVGEITPGWEDYGSTYENERAYAGYYRVRLADPDVYVELAATARVGVHRFWFPRRKSDANVLIDVGRSISWRQNAGAVQVVSDTEVEGRVRTGLFCAGRNDPTVYFVARFSRPAVRTGTWTGTTLSDEPAAEGRAGAFMRFSTTPGTPVVVAVALSYVSVENARENLEAEQGDRTFDQIREAAARSWQDVLGRIRVEGGTEGDRVRFYTALYHALLQPHVLNDTNGQYPVDGGVGSIDGDERYTVFSLWDTYRTLHPLLTLVYPERQLAMLRTLSSLARQWGRPPKWELIGEEVNPMVGDPLAIVAADSYFKGLEDFDAEGLYPIMKAASEDPEHRPGAPSYLALGYVPMEEADSVWGPVSTTLEYALSDANLSNLAAALGHAADASELASRARSYALFFDDTLGVLRPRNADGSFLDPFDPDALEGSAFQSRSGGPGYVEGTAWHYAFFVPHDMEGLVGLHTPQTFIDRLAWAFDTDRFVLWNEPDMAYPYLFNYVAGESWRTQRAVRTAMDRFFGEGSDGIPGNDDTGTLSAWFVFSAMGLYPDSPGVPRYSLGSPLFDRIEISLSPVFHQGESFVIQAIGNGPDRPYVSSADLDGTPLTGPFVSHAEVVAGGVLTLHMVASPP